MTFKVKPTGGCRPKKLAKCIPAFEADADEAYTAVPSTSGPPTDAQASHKQAAEQWAEKGSVFAQQGDTAAALRCWDQALLTQPDNSDVHEMRAQVLDAQGRSFEAIQAAQQAVTLRPDWPEAHITLARAQLNLGETQLALGSYQAAARLQPDHPDVVAELPTVQMYAKLHAQQQRQQPGSRAHVVQAQAGNTADEAAAATAAADVALEVAARVPETAETEATEAARLPAQAARAGEAAAAAGQAAAAAREAAAAAEAAAACETGGVVAAGTTAISSKRPRAGSFKS